MHHDRIPHREYATLAERFTAEHFDADAWAYAAAQAGMKYMVLTSRHHDGFCLWDSQVSDFTSVKASPSRRDFVAEYVDACRRQGLRVGFYYSLLDWRFPGYFERERLNDNARALVQQAHDQIRELLSNYGKIDLVWFDGHWFQDKLEWIRTKPEAMAEFWRADELLAMMRGINPAIIINDRTGLPGDYDTSEQNFGDRWGKEDRAWELCQTIGDFNESWCYMRYTPNPSRKSVSQLVIQLCMACAQNGNMLLNVGPKPDGTIPEADLERLRGIGAWIGVNGEAVYGTKSIGGNSCSFMVAEDNKGYILIPCWPGPEIIYPRIESKAISACLLGTSHELRVEYDEHGRLILRNLPESPPSPHVSVARVEFAEPVRRATGVSTEWITA